MKNGSYGSDIVYIVRRFVMSESGFLDEQAFSLHEKALEYARGITDEDDQLFITEVKRIALDSMCEGDSPQEIWYYNNRFELIKSNEGIGKGMAAVVPGLSVGDFVFIPRFSENEFGKEVDIVGVVASTPNGSGRHHKSCDTYTVYYISAEGYVDHDHFPVDGICRYESEISEMDRFLVVLQKYLRGNGEFREDSMKKILGGRVFVRNVVMADWGQEKQYLQL